MTARVTGLGPINFRRRTPSGSSRRVRPKEIRDLLSRSAFRNGLIEVMQPNSAPGGAPRRLFVAVCLVAAISAGCSSGGDESTSPSTTRGRVASSTTSTAATTTADATEAAVVAGYRAFWAAFLRAGDPMDPGHPDLAATAIGAQLEQVQRAFLARRAGGEVIRGTIETHPRLAGPIQSTTATIVDCYVDDSHAFDAETNAQKDAPGIVNNQVRVDMELIDGTWKVAAVRQEGEGCVP